MSTLSDIAAEITSQLPTGVSHEITAAKLRTVLIDLTTKILSDPALLGGAGGGTLERYLTSSTTASAGDICYCNTQAGGFTVTLPDTPIPGTGVAFRDAEGSWAAANLTVFPGNNKIEGGTGSLVCDVTNGNFDIVWSGTAAGWQVIPAISFAGTAGGGTGAGVTGGGVLQRYLTTGTAAGAGDICYCNTAAGGFTVTLPASPTVGTGVCFRDAESSWGTANLTVAPGNNKIENASGNLICDVTNGNFDLVWPGSNAGWQLVPAVTPAGTTGGGGGTGGGSNYFHVTNSTTAIVGATYYCDTLTTPFAITLPPAPSIGQGISFKDPTGGWGVNSLTVNPGTNAINSVATPLIVDQPDINFDLVWRGGSVGWQVEIPASRAVRGVVGSAGFVTSKPLGALAQTLTAVRGGAVGWDPTNKHPNIVLSNGNLTATATASATSLSLNSTSVRAGAAGQAGRYFELVWSTSANGYGVATAGQSLASYPGNPNGIGVFASAYVEWPGSGTGNTTGTTFGSGDVMGLLLGSTNVQFFKNGTLFYTVSTLPSGPLYPMLATSGAGESATANFGATVLSFLPAGATSWDGSRTTSGSTATWNPTDLSGVTLSNGDLTATGTGTGGGQVRGTRSGTATRYFEIHVDNGGSAGSIYLGLANASQSLTTGYAGNPNGISYFNNGYAEWPGGSGSGASYATGDVIGIRLLSSTAEFYKNGTLQFTAGGIPAGAVYPIVGVYTTTSVVTANFGATTFASPPSGATPWNT
jgi:hypothetical protein